MQQRNASENTAPARSADSAMVLPLVLVAAVAGLLGLVGVPLWLLGLVVGVAFVTIIAGSGARR